MMIMKMGCVRDSERKPGGLSSTDDAIPDNMNR